MKRTLVSGLLLLSLLLGLFSMTASAASVQQTKGPGSFFSDVPQDAWYYSYVEAAVEAGLVNGISSTQFVPNGTLTRAQFALMLYRHLGCPSVEGIESPFSDLSDAWYRDAVIYMASIGVIKGTGSTSFSPSKAITREQMLSMLYRLSDGVETTRPEVLEIFSDHEQISTYALVAMSWAIEQGIIQGVGGNKLLPHGYATRAQTVKVLCLFFGYITSEPKAHELRFWNTTNSDFEFDECLRAGLGQFAKDHPHFTLVYHSILPTEDPYTAIHDGIQEGQGADLILLSHPLDQKLAAEGSLLPLDGLLSQELLSTLREEDRTRCTYEGANSHMNGRLISFPFPGTDYVLVIPDAAQFPIEAAELLKTFVSATT